MSNYDNENLDFAGEGDKRAKRVSRIAIILAIVAFGEAVVIFLNHRKLHKQELALTGSEKELESTVSRLKSIQAELDQKIAEVQKLGGDVADLEKAKAEVEADLKNTRMAAGRNIARLKEKVQGYEELLRHKDEEIVKLKSANEQLFTENTSLKTTQNQLSDSIVQLSKNTENLAAKVAVGARLKAENLAVTAFNKKGKAIRAPFRYKQLQGIRVDFNIAKNDVASIEGKNIMIRVIDKNDRVIFDMKKGSGTFMREGKEQFYTASQEVLFNNTEQKVSFSYDKGSEYTPGRYQVEALCEGYVMGTSSFEVK